MSEELRKSRRPGRRHATSMGEGSSPEPMGYASACGHDACGPTCNVRYVGMTSHVRDHHAMHAARGVTHIWSAAIITGLAVVMTGAIAYSAVEARSGGVRGGSDMSKMVTRMEQMERALRDIRELCSQSAVDKAVLEKTPAVKNERSER